jgi:hypothetical protein
VRTRLGVLLVAVWAIPTYDPKTRSIWVARVTRPNTGEVSKITRDDRSWNSTSWSLHKLSALFVAVEDRTTFSKKYSGHEVTVEPQMVVCQTHFDVEPSRFWTRMVRVLKSGLVHLERFRKRITLNLRVSK